MTLPGRAVSLLLATGVAACAADARDAGFTVRDSAGVRIAESVTPVWSEGLQWTIAAQPTLRIGSENGPAEQILFRVSAARRLANGELVVATAGPELRRYDSRGAFIRSLGAVGDGPGDFRGIASIEPRSGDSIGIFDTGLARYTVLGPQGDFGRLVTLAGVRGGGIGPVGDLTDESYVAFILGSGPRERTTGLVREAHAFVRIDLAGGPVDTIGVFPGTERFQVYDGTGNLSGPVPFFRSRAQAVRGNDLLIAYTESFEIRTFQSTGEPKEIIRRAFPPSPVTDQQIAVWKERQMRFIRERPSPAPGGNQRRTTLVEEMVLHSTHPVLATLEVDSENNIWVQHALPPDDAGDAVRSRDWSVFDLEGRWLGEVRMPDRFRPHDIGSDYILGMTTDELGIEYLELYPLGKP